MAVKTIFQILTPRHFWRGFPLYVRAHIRFIILSAYLSLIFLTALCVPEEFFVRLAGRFGAVHPASAVVSALASAGLASFIGGFFLWKILRRMETALQSAHWRAHFGILSGVALLGESAIALSLAGLVWLSARWMQGQETATYASWIFAACLAVGAAALVLVTAIHGWMDNQFKEPGSRAS